MSLTVQARGAGWRGGGGAGRGGGGGGGARLHPGSQLLPQEAARPRGAQSR